MILALQQGLQDDGVEVSLVKLCRWFEVPRRSVYYRPCKGQPKLQDRFVAPIKALIEEHPSFGYRTVAHLLQMNKNTVQRVFQLKGWQVRKRPVGFRPRIQALPSVAKAPNERWATDLCRVWTGRDGWASLALVIDCHTRELLGWHLVTIQPPIGHRHGCVRRRPPVVPRHARAPRTARSAWPARPS